VSRCGLARDWMLGCSVEGGRGKRSGAVRALFLRTCSMNPRKSLAWRLLPSARRGGRWVGCEPSEPWEPGGPSLLPEDGSDRHRAFPLRSRWLMPGLFSATISSKPPFFHIVSRRHRASLKTQVSVCTVWVECNQTKHCWQVPTAVSWDMARTDKAPAGPRDACLHQSAWRRMPAPKAPNTKATPRFPLQLQNPTCPGALGELKQLQAAPPRPKAISRSTCRLSSQAMVSHALAKQCMFCISVPHSRELDTVRSRHRHSSGTVASY
jgi:hypothetical protein